MRYRILLTSAALVTAVMTSETLMHIDAQADEEIILSQQTDLFYKPSSLLEARLTTMNPLNPLGLCGLQNINGKFSFFNEDGTLHTGWQSFGENTVYYDEFGEFVIGLETLADEDGNEGIYYFNEDGLLTKGWQEIDGKKYYFNDNGKAETSTYQEGDMIYSFNAYGEMIESHQEVKQISEPVSYNPVIKEQPASIADSQPVSAPVEVEAPAVVDDGALGTISIGGYSARLYQGGSGNSVNQPIVDAENSAVLMNYLGRQMIADHAHQGFSVIRSCSLGLLGSLCGRTIVCASSYQGTNTGYGIRLDDGRWADEVYDGTYIMYTCNDAESTSVTVTFWN